MLDIINELSVLNGTSGDENTVSEFIRSKIPEKCKVMVDKLGNIIVVKKGKNRPNKKIMLCAHMDEVGFIVTDITNDGYLRFAAVGGISPSAVFGRQVCFANGTVGVIGGKAVHHLSSEEKGKQPKIENLMIDIGAESREEAEKLVSLGDYCYFRSEFFTFGDGYVKGKALDDRVGCAILLDMINCDLQYDCAFVFSVQEEIGARGAGTAAYYVRPDMAIVLETTTACDHAGVEDEKRICTLGDGCVVSYMDRSTSYDKELYRAAFEIAKKNSLSVQTKTMVAGGNDSGSIHRAVGGIRTIALSVPCRYLHTASNVIKECDIADTRILAEKMLEHMAML